MMGWKPTPKALLFQIKRYDRENGRWVDIAFPELRPGDVYASFAQDGYQVDYDGEPDTICYRVVSEPFKNETSGYGYTAEVEAGEFEDLISMGGN